MNYQQTLNYLFELLPMYQRIGSAAYKVDLSNTIELCQLLNNPQNNYKTIHVAGTNGKGSTTHMLASILQEAGYKVGLYTSPHLKDFRERIKVNGEMISELEVIDFVKTHKANFEKINLSFFEWTVGLAFDYFLTQQVDIAVIETGLGGRLDSTNIISPILSVITNIGIDHTQFLGDTLEKIASEKAGIIKHNVDVVIGESQPETKNVFINKANEKQSTIYFADELVNEIYEADLKGIYQQKNIKTVLQSIKRIQHNGFNISEQHIKKGLLNTVKNTGLMGRWQTLSTTPFIICDTGHNEAGIKEVISQLQQMKFNQLHFVFGAVNDKEIDSILNILPKSASYYFCKAQIPRALDVDKLYELATKFKLIGACYSSVKEALDAAKRNFKDGDLIFVGGSNFVVAEVV